MKTLPVADRSYRYLYDLAMGPLKAALLNCAIELELFDNLSMPRTADEIAASLSLHPENTRRFLDSLVTIGLAEKSDGRYRNRPIAGTFLVSGSPGYLGPFLKQTQNPGLNPLETLHHLIKEGPLPPSQAVDFSDESIWAEEVRASAGWVLGGVGQLVAEEVSGLPGFPGFRTLLDMGCGHGMFSLYLLEKSKTLSGILMDRAGVLDAARPGLEAFEALDRVSFLPGDYLQDDIGKGYDLIFASATLNFAIHCLPELVSRILDALNPGGFFVSFQDGMINEYTQPDTMLGAVMPMMMADLDYCFARGEIARTAVACGFESVRSKTLVTPIGEMDMDIARKSGRGGRL